MTDEERIRWIHSATLAQLLHKWSQAATSIEFFRGRVGEHYANELRWKKSSYPKTWQTIIKGLALPSIEGFDDIEPTRVIRGRLQ